MSVDVTWTQEKFFFLNLLLQALCYTIACFCDSMLLMQLHSGNSVQATEHYTPHGSVINGAANFKCNVSSLFQMCVPRYGHRLTLSDCSLGSIISIAHGGEKKCSLVACAQLNSLVRMGLAILFVNRAIFKKSNDIMQFANSTEAASA